MKAKFVLKGGSGSGHHGHAGRPGKHGGSAPGKGGGWWSTEPTKSAWPGPTGTESNYANIEESELALQKQMKDGYIKGYVITSDNGPRTSLKYITDNYPESKSFVVDVMHDIYGNFKKLRIVTNKTNIPDIGSKMAILFNTPKTRKIWYGNVILDDGKSYVYGIDKV